MGRNNKRNMKLQLKKPLNNKSNKNYSENHSKEQVLMSDFNVVNSENLENVNLDPNLINHINNIRNVDERMLIWNTNDVIDVQANERLHKCLNVDMVIRSMQGSPFAGYLQKQIDQLSRVSRASLSGAVMIPFDSDTYINATNLPQAVNNIKLNKDNEVNDSNMCAKSNKEALTVYTESTEFEVSSSTMSLNRTEQLNLSPIGTVRTSGRSAKKNYLDMLHQPFLSFRKSLVSNSENIENNKSNTRKSKRKSKVDTSEDRESVLNNNSSKENVKKEITKRRVTKNKLKENPLSVCEGNEEQRIISNIDQCEDTQCAVDSTIEGSLDDKVIETSVITKFDEKFDEMVDEIVEKVKEGKNKVSNKDSTRKAKVKEENTEKQKAIRRTSTKCITCDQMVEAGNTFSNMCQECCPRGQEIMDHVHSEVDLVCVADPPCWVGGDEAEKCDGCIIQRYLAQGIEWSDKHWSLIGLTNERLRSQDMVRKAKESMKKEGQRVLESLEVARESCVIGDDGPLERPCQWDISTFVETEARDHCCDICKQLTGTSDKLYYILPSKEYSVCNHCLLRAFETRRRSPEPCTNIVSCDHCFLSNCQSLFPLDAVRRRYRPLDDDSKVGCRICLGVDESLLRTLRSGTRLCLACVWRIKVHIFSDSDTSCDGECMPWQCGACLVEIAGQVTSVRDVVTYRTALPRETSHSTPPPSNESPPQPESDTEVHPQIPAPIHLHRHKRVRRRPGPKPKIRQIESLSVQTKPKKSRLKDRYTFTTSPPVNTAREVSAGEGRQKRRAKPTRFNDYFVGDKNITRVFGNRKNSRLFTDYDDDQPTKKTSNVSETKDQKETSVDSESSEDHRFNEDDHDILDLGDHKVVDGHEGGNHRVVSGKRIRRKKKLEIVHKVKAKKGLAVKKFLEERVREPVPQVTKEIAEVPRNRRIKQAIVDDCEPLIVRTGGPRVKQVSRIGVSTSLDLSRQRCVVKAANRPGKLSETTSEDVTKEMLSPDMPKDDDQQWQDSVPNDDEEFLRSSGGFNLAVVSNEGRPSAADDSPYFRGNDTSMVNDGTNGDDADNTGGKDEWTKGETEPRPVTPVEEVTGARRSSIVTSSLCRLAEIDVYRDSDNEDVVSEEENIDPDLDSIQTVKTEIITTALAHDGGYPIVTSRNAMPNKVLCYSCGSGGDQMIHCVSCAEPFHFFCIEFQFRPKSKEMFVCRNCTKCHSCNLYGSDLKCIKCQLGFHPSCADKYPPSRGEDRSNWACYKCAMCIHCGTRAEDVMDGLAKDAKQIDWSGDPWQCGRCFRSRRDGHVCPECGRAYLEGLETVDCHRCSKSVHRQCVGLTEDEYELQKDGIDPVAAAAATADTVDGVVYECTECEELSADAALGDKRRSRRVNLKRQCKESGLKIYCEKQVTRRVSEFIRQSESREEQLLDEHNLVLPVVHGGADFDQMDGAADDEDDDDDDEDEDDDDDDDDGSDCESEDDVVGVKVALVLPVVEEDFSVQVQTLAPMHQTKTSAAMCNSSESIEEYDFDQLTTSDMDHCAAVAAKMDLSSMDLSAGPHSPRTKVGIFSRLLADDFISPRHMITEALARILMKLGRYSPLSPMAHVYSTLMTFMDDLCGSLFPWIDYQQCMETATEVVKSHSARTKLVLKIVADTVRDSLQREMEVFSSTVWDIEEKLYQSLVRGREEFIIFHSEQNLSSLMKNIESSEAPSDRHYCRYKVAFDVNGNGNGDGTVYEDDVRRCGLCGNSGDDGLEGRLIYGSVDVWVHVNCALWSDEVYERDDGALVNVDVAIKRGQTTTCDSCHRSGATVRCSAISDACNHCYHFSCAFNRLRDPVFTESRTFYCSETVHEQSHDERQLGLSDMLILRRIYMPRVSPSVVGGGGGGGHSGLAGEDIVVTVGNLRIDHLGTLRPHSDAARTYLCPVEYKARRLFWSMTELDCLEMYYMSISDKVNDHPRLPCKGPLSMAMEAAQAPPPPPMPQKVARHSSVMVAKRRRVIDTVDSRQAKRPRFDDYRTSRDIVYEMDDLGNLRPIIEGGHSNSKVNYNSNETRPPPNAAAAQSEPKVNRRFPKDSRVGRPAVHHHHVIGGGDQHHGDHQDDDDDDDSLKILSIDMPPPPPTTTTTTAGPMAAVLSATPLSSSYPPIRVTQYNHRKPVPLYIPSAVPQTTRPCTLAQYRPYNRAGDMMLSPPAATSTTQAIHLSVRHSMPLDRRFHRGVLMQAPMRPSLLPPPPATPVIIRRTVPISQHRPPTIIRLPSNTHYQSRMSVPVQQQMPHGPPVATPATKDHQPQQILKVTKLTPIMHRSSPMTEGNLSVLRTVLTTESAAQRQPVTGAKSDYFISSSGTLVRRAGPSPSTSNHNHHPGQYDGETDDLSANDDSISSCGSDHETMSTAISVATANNNKVRKTKTSQSRTYSDYESILLFTIQGFTTNRSPKSAWTYLVRKVAKMRSSQGFTEYPLKTGDGWSKFGLDHRSIVFLIEQMLGAFNCRQYEFKYHKAAVARLRDQYSRPTAFNGARTLHWVNELPENIARDPLAFLRCKSNQPPKNHAPDHLDPPEDIEPDADYIQHLAIQFRKLKSGVLARIKNVRVCVSDIHGRGLFARREFSPHEIIIEYVGETIRSIMSDQREVEYQKSGVDCYMFRLDQDMIVDATYQGNAARFINHSCQPNCYAKVVKFEGEKHIIIIAQRRIYKGEELTYDYRFPLEDDKLPCSCGSRRCRKYLN